jgi:hypothetical protein
VHDGAFSGRLVHMSEGHLDRQPPRDEEEAEEQDRIIESSGDVGDVEIPTDAPADDIQRPEA